MFDKMGRDTSVIRGFFISKKVGSLENFFSRQNLVTKFEFIEILSNKISWIFIRWMKIRDSFCCNTGKEFIKLRLNSLFSFYSLCAAPQTVGVAATVFQI